MAKVLVVEDDQSVSKLFRTVLEIEGHDVTVCPDGMSGLRGFQEVEPDVVVLDWMMPGMSGLEMLEKIKASGHRGRTRVILVTGKVQETDMLRAWQAGIDEYLTKPVPLDKLTETVDWVLRAGADELEKRRAHEMERTKLLRTLNDLDDW